MQVRLEAAEEDWQLPCHCIAVHGTAPFSWWALPPPAFPLCPPWWPHPLSCLYGRAHTQVATDKPGVSSRGSLARPATRAPRRLFAGNGPQWMDGRVW